MISLPARRAFWMACVVAQFLPPSKVARAEETQLGAEDDLDTGVNLEQLLNLKVVTASGGVEEERSMAPASVVVFGRDEITRQGWRSLADILRNTPGLDVIDDEVMPSVGVRGVTGGFRGSTRIVKVMIDGVAVNFRPDLAAFIGPEYIPVEVIERVEIAKGPLSAIYGANAFLAVVNVITVRASALPVAAVNLRSNLIRDVAGYGVSAVIAESAGPLELVAAFAVDKFDRSGLRVEKTVPAIRAQMPLQERFVPFFQDASQNDVAEPRSLFLSLRLPLGRWGALSVEGGRQHLDSMGEFQLNSVLTHKSRIAIDNTWSAAHYEKSWSDQLHLTTTVAYSTGAPTRDEILYLTNNYLASFTPQFRYQAFDGGFQLSYTPGRRLSFVLGADGSYEPQRTLYYTQTFHSVQGTNAPGDTIDVSIGPADQRDIVVRNAGAYVQMNAVPIARVPMLRLTMSGRLDVPSLFSVQYSWRGAIAYRVSPGVVVKVFAGRAFQVPSAVLLYGHSGFGAANNVIGNRTVAGLAPLRPQVLNSIEAAVNASPSRMLMLEANVSYQQIQDRIEFAQAGADFIARNQGVGRNVDLEVSAKAFFARLRPYAAVAVQRMLIDGSLDTPPPPIYPNYWFRGGIEGDFPELHLRSVAQVRWVGARTASQSNVLLNNNRPYELPGYARVDLTVTSSAWRPFRPGPEVTVTLHAQNLLDDRSAVPGFGGMDPPALGRVLLLQVGFAH